MKFKDDIVVNKSAAIEITGSIVDFVENKPFKIIADAQNILGTVTAEGRKVFSTNPMYIKLRLKAAFVINNLPTRLLITFYQKVNLKHKNTKSFSTLNEALEWVRKD